MKYRAVMQHKLVTLHKKNKYILYRNKYSFQSLKPMSSLFLTRVLHHHETNGKKAEFSTNSQIMCISFFRANCWFYPCSILFSEVM